MKLRFTPRAAQDLAAIAVYIRERNPPAALRAIAQAYCAGCQTRAAEYASLFHPAPRRYRVLLAAAYHHRHCERSEAIHSFFTLPKWIASLRSQ
jgi:plasmid stabilization system protein ParE